MPGKLLAANELNDLPALPPASWQSTLCSARCNKRHALLCSFQNPSYRKSMTYLLEAAAMAVRGSWLGMTQRLA
jgi:hypothetical protein